MHNEQEPIRLDPERDLRQLTMFAKYPVAALAPGATSIHYTFLERGHRYFFNVAAERPGQLATLADGDVLIYVASYLAALQNRGRKIAPRVPFRPAEMLRFLGRASGGRQVRLIEDAVERLFATTLNSDYSPPGCASPSFDTLISRFERAASTRRICALWVGPWFVDQVREHRLIKINGAGLRLRGLERRIYGWAEAHLANASLDGWSIRVDRAWFKSIGSPHPQAPGAFRKFRHALRGVVKTNRLPGYSLSLEASSGELKLSIRRAHQHGVASSFDQSAHSIIIPHDNDAMTSTEIHSIIIPLD